MDSRPSFSLFLASIMILGTSLDPPWSDLELYLCGDEFLSNARWKGVEEVRLQWSDKEVTRRLGDQGRGWRCRGGGVTKEDKIMKVNIVDNVIKDSESVDDLDAKNMNHNVDKIDDKKEESQTVVMDDVLHVSGPEDNEAESANEVEE
ncbi:hypothetical protein Tco_0948756 [Tanacetum coccineum]